MNQVVKEHIESFNNLTCYTLNLAAVSKPRMTQRDRWKVRPAVARYHAFKDALRVERKKTGLDGLPGHISMLIFYMKIPKTIDVEGKRKSTKKMDLENCPIFVRPDVDNYIKAFFDAMETEDNFIHTVAASKRYSKNPRIEVYINETL